VRGRGYLRGSTDIEKTVIKVQNGTPVLVRHVA
jgi:Cu/Ag efflux pump CusA